MNDGGHSVNLRAEIHEMIREYQGRHGRPPTRLFLTPTQEAAGLLLRPADVGKLSDEIMAKGFREAVVAAGNRFLGLDVHWDAEGFGVG